MTCTLLPRAQHSTHSGRAQRMTLRSIAVLSTGPVCSAAVLSRAQGPDAAAPPAPDLGHGTPKPQPAAAAPRLLACRSAWDVVRMGASKGVSLQGSEQGGARREGEACVGGQQAHEAGRWQPPEGVTVRVLLEGGRRPSVVPRQARRWKAGPPTRADACETAMHCTVPHACKGKGRRAVPGHCHPSLPDFDVEPRDGGAILRQDVA